MKSYFKNEIARAAGVSYWTFNRWLKTKEQQLRQLGVLPGSRLLPPIAVQWVCQEYGIDPHDL